MHRVCYSIVLALTLFAISCGAVEAPPDESERLRAAVTPEGIMEHAREFQAIAGANEGNRAAGTPGYDVSAEYVAQELRKASYEVTVQPFEFPHFEELAPARLQLVSPEGRSYDPGEDFELLQYSGSGDVTASARPVDLGSSTSGCEPPDFDGFREGDVALIQRGTCTFGQKVKNAEAAGAVAVVIFDVGGTDAFTGTLDGPGADIPVVSASSGVGEELASFAGGATVRVAASTSSGSRETVNVIAESKAGREESTVVVGAHLDSVPEGPGINDNGSGSATVLEIARQTSALDIKPRNRVRFAFWGAEELGLLGSTHYVEGLSEREVESVAVYLNFDMLGSPNFARFVYDGSGNPQGSEQVEDAFTDYYESRDLESETDSSLVGRSDHGPFADKDVPVGGLFSGAEEIKSTSEAADYGGEAGEALDPCYHQPCDDIDNLDHKSLDQMSDAAAEATLRFASAK